MRKSKAAFAHEFCDGHHKKALYNLWLQIFFEPSAGERAVDSLNGAGIDAKPRRDLASALHPSRLSSAALICFYDSVAIGGRPSRFPSALARKPSADALGDDVTYAAVVVGTAAAGTR
jgi:hypothetical protein